MANSKFSYYVLVQFPRDCAGSWNQWNSDMGKWEIMNIIRSDKVQV